MRTFLSERLLRILVVSGCLCTVASVSVHAEEAGFQAALVLAKNHDPEFEFARQRFLSEQEEDDIALSNLLPSISMEGVYRRQVVDDIYTDESSSYHNSELARSDRHQSDSSLRLNLRQPLINVAAWKGYKRDQVVTEQSEYVYRRAEQEITYRLAKAYLETLLAEQKTHIYKEKLTTLQLKVGQENRRLELGVGDRLSVLRIKASRDLAQSDLLEANSALDDARTRLENITGERIDIPAEWIKASFQVIPVLSTGTLDEWTEKTAENAQVLAELASVRKTELDLSAKKAERLPTLDFNLAASRNYSDDVFEERTDLVASINLKLPLYTGGRVSAFARRAEADHYAARARYEKTRSDTMQVVKLAFNRLVSFKERLEALEGSRKSSQAFLTAAEREVSLSLASQIDVLEMRDDLYDVQLEFATTMTEYLGAELDLRLETGMLGAAMLSQFDTFFDSQIQ